MREKTVGTCGAGKEGMITAVHNKVKFWKVVLNLYLALRLLLINDIIFPTKLHLVISLNNNAYNDIVIETQQMNGIHVCSQQVQHRKLPKMSLCAVKEAFHKYHNYFQIKQNLMENPRNLMKNLIFSYIVKHRLLIISFL